MSAPQLYNDDRLSEIAREVYYKAMSALRDHFNEVPEKRLSEDRMCGVAQAASAAAEGFKDDEEDEEDGPF